MGITNVLVVFVLVAGTGAVAEDTPSPALLVLHKGENAMAIVDPSNGKVVGHVPTGQDPHELVVSDDGKLAFASNYAAPGPRGGNTLSVIDIANRKELHRVDLSPLMRPHGLWFSNGKLYFTAEGSMAIARYDPATNKVDWLLGLGQDRTHMILVSKDQKTIFTSNVSSNTISIIERGGPHSRAAGRSARRLRRSGRQGVPVVHRRKAPPGGPVDRPPDSPGGPPPGVRIGPGLAGPGGPPPGGSAVLRRVGPAADQVVGRLGDKRSSRSAGALRALTSRPTASSCGQPTWATEESRSSTSPPRKSSIQSTPAPGHPIA